MFVWVMKISLRTIRPPAGRRTALLAVAVAALSLASCATTYGAFGSRGGYRDFQESKTQYHVYFLANSNTSKETAYRFFLTRAAQIVLRQGYDYFYVSQLTDSTRSRVFVTPGTERIYSYRDFIPDNIPHNGFLEPHPIHGNIMVYRPPVFDKVSEPGYEGQILLVKGQLKGQPPPFDARILYREGMKLNDRIKSENRKAGIAAGVGTAVVIGVAAVAGFLGSGGSIAFSLPLR